MQRSEILVSWRQSGLPLRFGRHQAMTLASKVDLVPSSLLLEIARPLEAEVPDTASDSVAMDKFGSVAFDLGAVLMCEGDLPSAFTWLKVANSVLDGQRLLLNYDSRHLALMHASNTLNLATLLHERQQPAAEELWWQAKSLLSNARHYERVSLVEEVLPSAEVDERLISLGRQIAIPEEHILRS